MNKWPHQMAELTRCQYYFRLTGSVLCCIFLAACSHVPSSSFTPPIEQPLVLSGSHWELMASESARDLKEHIQSRSGASMDQVRVVAKSRDSAFGRAYEKFLEQELIKSGVPITRRAGVGVVVNVEVDTYLYSRRTGGRIPFTSNTVITTLALFSPELFFSSLETTRLSVVALAAAYDILRAKSYITDAEAVLTTTIIKDDEVSFLKSRTFYIEPRDALLYWDSEPLSPLVDSRKSSADALRTKKIEVTK